MSQQSPALSFTAKAAEKVWELIKEEDNFNLKLRAFVTGGGCSGMKYGFTFDEAIEEGDTVITQTITQDGKDIAIYLLIDMISLPYLTGAEIDYKEDIEGEQFIIRNPNATTTCGCGSSFSTD